MKIKSVKKTLLIATAVVAPFIAIDVVAQMGGGGGGGNRGERPDFSTLDADNNGSLSIEELQVMETEDRPGIAATVLSRMDADEDGELSEEEFSARNGGGGGGGGGNRNR